MTVRSIVLDISLEVAGWDLSQPLVSRTALEVGLLGQQEASCHQDQGRREGMREAETSFGTDFGDRGPVEGNLGRLDQVQGGLRERERS